MGTNMVWLVVLIWILNMGISYWNARVTGLMWVESKVVGGWPLIMAWCGAIMSASGFTWCYLIVLLLGGHYIEGAMIMPGEEQSLDWQTVKAGLSLGYIIIVPGVLATGLLIWVDSMIQAWKRRDFASVGTAAWNTFAQVHNTYSAMSGFPDALKEVGNFFGGSSDAKAKGVVFVLILVALAIVGGILTTWSIITKYAGSRQLEAQPAA